MQERSMPNGRSGSFMIELAGLKQLVQAVSENTIVGKLLTASRPFGPVSALEIARCLEGCRQDRIAVEELDHAAYIIHINKNLINVMWLLVDAESPIFREVWRRHDQFSADTRPGPD